ALEDDELLDQVIQTGVQEHDGGQQDDDLGAQGHARVLAAKVLAAQVLGAALPATRTGSAERFSITPRGGGRAPSPARRPAIRPRPSLRRARSPSRGSVGRRTPAAR